MFVVWFMLIFFVEIKLFENDFCVNIFRVGVVVKY